MTAGHAAASGTWGQATPAVFGSGVQSTTPYAWLNAVSCGSVGNCTATGYFGNAAGGYEAFTLTSTAGVWGQATPAVFGSGVQSTTPDATLTAVSCGSAGNCTAAGRFRNAAGGYEAFTLTSTAGVWGQAAPAVFDSGVQNTASDAYFTSVSCVSAGNCTAAGYFRNAAGGSEAFTSTSTAGVWGQATPAVFAAGVQNTNPDASFESVSCGSAGNCTAVGQFRNFAGGLEAFTMTSTAGVWGQATPAVFASGVQNTNPDAYFFSVSCRSAGNCTAVGYFRNVAGGIEAFTSTSTAGVWGQATPAVFAAGVQNTTPDGSFNSVSCVSAGNCTAAGRFRSAAGGYEAFTLTSTAGVWGQATPVVFGAGVQNTTPDATFTSVSCVSAGNCTAVGRFRNAAGGVEAFTLTSTAGVWGRPTPAVFGAGVQNTTPDATLNSVSCTSAGNCTAAGRFLNAAGGYEAFTMPSIDNTPPSTNGATSDVSLPATGSDSSGPLVVALFAVVAGVAMMVRRRRLVD